MFIVAQCCNRSPFGWLFVECLEVTVELLKSEKFELQFLRLRCTNCLFLTVRASHRCPVSSNRCRAVIFAAALRPFLQPPAGTLPAGSPLPAALPQHSEETHTNAHACKFQTEKLSPASCFSSTCRATRSTSRKPTAAAPSHTSHQRPLTTE